MLRRNLRSSAVAFLAPDALEAIKKCLTEVIPAFVSWDGLCAEIWWG